jgi:hypothetical protein
MHMPEVATKTFAITSDIILGLLAGLAGAAFGPKIAGVLKAAVDPRHGARHIGEAIGENTVRPEVRAAEVTYLRSLVQVHAPALYEVILNANKGWGLLRDSSGKVFYREERLWGNLKALYDAYDGGTKSEKEAAFILELQKLERLVQSGNFQQFLAELGTLEEDQLIQRAAYYWAKLSEEYWPWLQAPLELGPGGSTAGAFIRIDRQLNAALKRKKERWF